MLLSKLVEHTLKINKMDVSKANAITASLRLAGINFQVKSTEIKNVQNLIKTQAQNTKAPAKITAGFQHTEDVCPYCKQPMQEVTLTGNLIKRARFCKNDRITLPFAN